MRCQTILVTLCALAAFASAQVAAKVKAASPDQSQIARGKYIVDDVSRCTMCHTPQNAQGQQIASEYLMGGPVPYQSSVPKPDWAVRVPRIAGGPPGTDEEFIREMMTGISRFGRPLDPPMPTFHMTREDAQAVLAYLKSLKR